MNIRNVDWLCDIHAQRRLWDIFKESSIYNLDHANNFTHSFDANAISGESSRKKKRQLYVPNRRISIFVWNFEASMQMQHAHTEKSPQTCDRGIFKHFILHIVRYSHCSYGNPTIQNTRIFWDILRFSFTMNTKYCVIIEQNSWEGIQNLANFETIMKIFVIMLNKTILWVPSDPKIIVCLGSKI